MKTLNQKIANLPINIGEIEVLNTVYDLKGDNTHGQYIFANTDALFF